MSEPDPKEAGNPPSGALHGLDPGGLFDCALEDGSLPSGKKWEPPTVENIARLLPQFDIVECLGRGGMGAVYRGTQAGLARGVAIKVLPLEMAADPEFALRFKKEMQILADLDHPHIVKVYESGRTADDHLFFVMELADGNLQKFLEKGPLPPELALSLTSQICGALKYAHEQGLVHRDIKPANILTTKNNEAKLADFGLARLMSDSPDDSAEIPLPIGPHQDFGSGFTGSQMTFGTPPFASPEQEAGRADHRSDIFALGVTLHMMLTGQAPPKQGTAHRPKTTPFDVRLDEIVQKAVERELDRRYQKIDEMKIAVDRIRTGPAKHARLVFAGSVIAAFLLLFVGFLVWQRNTTSGGNSAASTKASAAPNAGDIRETHNVLTSEEIADGWKLLFNGKDLTGWKGLPAIWSVAEGAITVTATAANPAREDQDLIWQGGTVSDFEITYQGKTQPRDGAKHNHGFFCFRGQLIAPGNSQVSGFQQGILSSPLSGFMRDAFHSCEAVESGQNAVLIDSNDPKKPTSQITNSGLTPEERAHLVKRDDWNDYRIKAVGNHLQIYVNGKQVVDVVDQTSNTAKSGLLALKVYQGSRLVMQVRNIKLKELGAPKSEQTQSVSLARNQENFSNNGGAKNNESSTSILEAAHPGTAELVASPAVDPIAGRWRFSNKSIRTFALDGVSIDQNGQPAVWRSLNPRANPRHYEITYGDGKLKDDLTMNDRGTFLEGRGINGVHVRAWRIVPPLPADATPESAAVEPEEWTQFRQVLLTTQWHYTDVGWPSSTVFFYEDGTFHPRWHWNYWIVSRRTLHIQFWDPIYKPETAEVFTFNEDLTEFTCPKADGTQRIVGTREEPPAP